MDFFIFVIGALLLLATLDLIVGVSNDAVNFLNSAIGSQVAPYRTIILIAIAGIILGSIFSSGIMEIARKGIFYPQYFTFEVILIVFLAVMLTDIILLDVFNSLGLPTSTTVSIIFELLGAALMVGILFSMSKNENINEIRKYINFESSANLPGIFNWSTVWREIFNTRCSGHPFTPSRSELSGRNGSFVFGRQEHQRIYQQGRDFSGTVGDQSKTIFAGNSASFGRSRFHRPESADAGYFG